MKFFVISPQEPCFPAPDRIRNLVFIQKTRFSGFLQAQKRYHHQNSTGASWDRLLSKCTKKLIIPPHKPRFPAQDWIRNHGFEHQKIRIYNFRPKELSGTNNRFPSLLYHLRFIFDEIRDQKYEFDRFSDQKCWFQAWKFSCCSRISDPVFQYFSSWWPKKISKTLFLIHKYHKTSCCKIRVRSEQFENSQHEHELSGLEANAPKSKHLIFSNFSYWNTDFWSEIVTSEVRMNSQFEFYVIEMFCDLKNNKNKYKKWFLSSNIKFWVLSFLVLEA